MHPHSLRARVALGLAALTSIGFGQAVPDANEPIDRIRYNLILPDEKSPETVKPTENNPFTKSDGKKVTDDQTSSEENTVRNYLAALNISGVSKNPDGELTCMLGSWRLTAGSIVPKIMDGQTVMLKVNTISPGSLDLVWVENKKGQPPRVLSFPIGVLQKRVRIMMANAAPAKVEAPGSRTALTFTAEDGALPKAPVQARRATVIEDEAPVAGAGAEQPADSSTTPPGAQPKPVSVGSALLNLLTGGAAAGPTQAAKPKPSADPTPAPAAQPSAQPLK